MSYSGIPWGIFHEYMGKSEYNLRSIDISKQKIIYTPKSFFFLFTLLRPRTQDFPKQHRPSKITSPLVVKSGQWQLFSSVSDMLNDSSQRIYCSWKLTNWILTCLGCSDTQDQGSAWLCKSKQAKFTNSCQFEIFFVCLFINNVMICAHSLQYLFREPKLLVRFLGQLQMNSAYLTLIWYFEQIKNNSFSP